MKRLFTTGILCAAGFAAVGAMLGACGADSGSGGDATTDGAGGGSTDSGKGGNGSGASTQSGNNVGGGFNLTGGNGPGGPGSGGGSQCGGVAKKAKPIPLDMYIMLDISGSMEETVGTSSTTKLDAVKEALGAFLQDPDTQGIGVGLQFFPLQNDDVPDTCMTNAECIGHGPCALKVCNTHDYVQYCSVNADCDGVNCIPVGSCSGYSCWPASTGTTTYTCGGGLGKCVQVGTSFCVGKDSCTVSDYSTPQVEIAPVNATSAQDLIDAMALKEPVGATPTYAALSGAVAHAQTWASSHATHTVIAVLATDGLPRECDPTVQNPDDDIANVAAIAAQGASASPAVRTFVIGAVAGADEITNLNAIAAAGGGTQEAFIIDPSQPNFVAKFEAAMKEIRGAKLACEYEVPESDGGEQDFSKVNVEFSPPGGGQPKTVGYVGKLAACDPAKGGWYYDVDPSDGTPTKIIMCPATCGDFGKGGSVDIRVGCSTVVQPPPS